MKLNKLILIILIISTEVLNAQTDFRSGYIIKNSGDTLYGNIDYRGDLLMSSVCKFKNADNVIKDYSPSEITAFRFIDSKYFVSKVINNRYVFLEFLIDGEIDFYYMRDEKGDHYYIDKEGELLTEMPYEEGIKYIDKKNVYYESKKHIGILIYYMQDAPEFQSRIKKVKEPEHQELIELAKDYHNKVCEGTKCIIYNKNPPLIKLIPEIVGGITYYENVDDINETFYFHGGVLTHFWMPRTNEKMYFKTGILFVLLEDVDGKKVDYYKFPIQLEYIYPKGLFRPRLSYGLNFYYPGYRSVSLSLGTNIKLSDTKFISIFSDIEFNSKMVLVPAGLLSYSLYVGLLIKL